MALISSAFFMQEKRALLALSYLVILNDPLFKKR